MHSFIPCSRHACAAATVLLILSLSLRAQAAAAAAPVAPYAPTAPASITLKDAFKGVFHVGVALNPGQFTGSNPRGAALVLREFDCISPENVMKMGPIHPRPGNDDSSYDFGPADQYVAFGEKHHLFIIGHNLCWHSQMPGWLSQQANNPAVTKEELTQFLHDHIMKVAGRYKGRVNGWDVVNEAIDDGQGGYRNSIFYRVIGKEYLVLAFKWAHEADPAAELYYNDYNLDASDAKRATCVELVKYLKENGAPITGIGLQCHYNSNTPTVAKIDETIRRFADLGLKVMVTELDVRATANAPLTGAVAAAGGQGDPARGTRGGRGGLPAIDAMKTSVALTDAQVAQIAPLLEQHAAILATAAGDFAKVRDSRTATIAAITPLLTPEQLPKLTALVAPVARGGRGDGQPPAPLTAEQQQALARRYGEIFAVFLKHRDVITRVTFWGLRDADSWRRGDSPLIFDDNFERKPAYDGVIHALTLAGMSN